MSATTRRPRFRGLNLLPDLFATSLRGAALPPLGWRYHVILAAILLPPAMLTIALDYGQVQQAHVNATAHSLLEGFCALMSLVVFYVLYQEFINTGTCRLRVVAFAFLVLGLLDGCHALSPPHSQLFVWFRSTAALFSSIMLAIALGKDGLCRRTASDPMRANIQAVAFGSGVLLFALGSFALRDDLPFMIVNERFSALTLLQKGLAGLAYMIAGITFLHYFRRSREIILFILAVAMFLFAESQLLVFFSDPWDRTWWIWHWIRTVVFIGILIGIAHEFVRSAQDLQKSHHELVEAEKLASLGEMAASIAHEIRNPLGTLTGSVDLLRDGRTDPAQREELISLIEREINRLNHIVSDTLAFAHPSDSRLHILNLANSLHELSSTLGRDQSCVSIEIDIPENLPLVRANEILIQRIAWNLFENAAAAMSGRGVFRIAAARDGNRIRVEFCDTGPGMAPELLSQVVKPFFTTKETGVGLGLPIVHRMVSEQGGTMEISSESGKGTCVAIFFPVIAG